MEQAIDINKAVKDLANNVDTSANLMKPISEWRTVLSLECQVYVCGRSYIAKRFDEINYQFCEEAQAIKVVKDNLYALLRFKYFPQPSEESDERIDAIVKSFTVNLKTTLRKVSFNEDDDCTHIQFLPDYCCAFRNGVYDFKNNKWLFKYDVIRIPYLSNSIYMYDYKWAIMWFLNIDFKPLEEIDIMNDSLSDVIDLMKEVTNVDKNYCFELMYNMSHDYDDNFSLAMFEHLSEYLGYLCLQSFCQAIPFMVGAGGNGKNSLVDGCFTSRVIPTPSNISLEMIENNDFISGALQGLSHNIHLETSTDEKPHTQSENIKNLTGSMYQSIHKKGVDIYSGLLNCKQMHAANSQDHLKFSDTTDGFRRRINVFEIWYKWDKDKHFLKKGDYYDDSFSDDYREIKADIHNTTMFIYFAMFGIKLATKDFTESFRFTHNDWNLKYTDVNIELKDKIDAVTIDMIDRYMSSKANAQECRTLFFDLKKKRLYESESLNELGYVVYEDLRKFFSDYDTFTSYFANNDVYINLKILRQIVGTLESQTSFTQTVKKLYGIDRLRSDLYNNQPYCKCRFVGKKLKLLK